MGANDAAEMLEAAKAECVHLERENAALRAERSPVEVVERIRRESVLAAADWLESRRYDTWNGGTRRPSNYGRAAEDLRWYATAGDH